MKKFLTLLLAWWAKEKVYLESELAPLAAKAEAEAAVWTEKQLTILKNAEQTINNTMVWFNQRLSALEERLDGLKVTATATVKPAAPDEPQDEQPAEPTSESHL